MANLRARLVKLEKPQKKSKLRLEGIEYTIMEKGKDGKWYRGESTTVLFKK